MSLLKKEGLTKLYGWEDPDFRKVQEADMMNLFFVIGDTVLTPKLTGAVLKGTTRNYFLDILKKKKIKEQYVIFI